MGISLILCGVAARYVADTSLSESQRFSYGCVTTAGTFVYTATFGATWLTVPWLYPSMCRPSFKSLAALSLTLSLSSNS